MTDWLTQFHLEYGYLIKPLIVGTLVSLVCSVVGCFIILRRLSFLSDAIAHAMLAGVVGGYLLMKMLFGSEAHVGAMLIGALLAGVLTVAMVGFVTRVSRIKQDTAIGVMYTGIFASAAFVVSMKAFGQHIHIDIYHFILGSVISVSDAELWIAGIVTAVVLAVIILFYRHLQLTSFDPVMAASIGIPVLAVDYLLTACTSLVVVSGVRTAGVILIVALIITPAASAYLLFDRLHRMILAAGAIGVVCVWLGFGLATWAGTSLGPSIVVVSTAFFMLTLTLAPHYGLLADWLRQRRAVPQEVKEDVLGSVLRSGKPWVPIHEVIKYVDSRNLSIRRAIQSLIRQDFLDEKDGNLKLTKNGRREGRRLLRAHRIWETYLERAGTPESQIHQRAHVLEHLNDERTIDYLDDKMGHPLTDPHGREIPEDFVDLEKKDAFRASLLREGHRAEVDRVEAVAENLGVDEGMTIDVGPRTSGGRHWTFVLPDGRQLSLSHDQADAIFVRLIDSEPN